MQLRLPWLKERIPLIAFASWDCFVGFSAYAALYHLRMGSWWGQTSQALSLVLGWVSLSYLLGRYTKKSIQDPRRKPWRSKTLTVAALLLLGIQLHSWLFRVLMEATRYRGFLLPYIGTLIAGSQVGQAWLRKRYKHQPDNWLIIGNEPETRIIEQECWQEKAIGKKIQDCKFASEPQNITREINSRRYSGIAISISMLKNKEIEEKLLRERKNITEWCSLEDWCEENLQRIPPELLDNRSLLVSDGYQLQPGSLNWRIKRLGDVVVSTILLTLSIPVIAIAMAAIKLEDGGPCYYTQTRTGLHGNEIEVHKLRTMHVEAEREGAQWAQANDPRITTCGRWLRKFRIDELPQLWAVLVGDMSLIGPRPERPELEQQLVAILPNYYLRSWLRPGLSGWAQVCYPYGASVADSRNKLSYDLYYLRNANIFLDLLILLKTIRLVTFGQGATPLTKTQRDYENESSGRS